MHNKAIALLSGGVDSIRAIKMIPGRGMEIRAIGKQAGGVKKSRLSIRERFPSGKVDPLHIGA